MILEDIEKEIIRDVMNGRLTNILSFIRQYVTLYPVAPQPDNIFIIDQADALDKLKLFIAVCNQLEQLDLVLSVKLNRYSSAPIYSADGKGSIGSISNPTLLHLANRYVDYEIIPLPALDKFVDNDYHTESEIQFIAQSTRWEEEMEVQRLGAEVEKRARVNAQFWVKVIGISGIIISLLTAILQFITYRTDRSVTITNPDAFHDTTKVFLLNQTYPTKISSQPDTASLVSDTLAINRSRK